MQGTLEDHLTLGGHGVHDPSKRERATVREISPCSEYTRFTMEGTMKDPYSEMAVMLHTPSLGVLFMNGPLSGARWSDALGYGIAVIEGDTRIHLYRTGKFVIRRALDRDHVERCFRLICCLAEPSILLPYKGLIFWEALTLSGSVKDSGLLENIAPALNWPDDVQDPTGALERMVEGPAGLKERLREGLFPDIELSLDEDKMRRAVTDRTMDGAREKVLLSLRSSMREHIDDGPLMVSSASIHLAALKALDELQTLSGQASHDSELKRTVLSSSSIASSARVAVVKSILSTLGEGPETVHLDHLLTFLICLP